MQRNVESAKLLRLEALKLRSIGWRALGSELLVLAEIFDPSHPSQDARLHSILSILQPNTGATAGATTILPTTSTDYEPLVSLTHTLMRVRELNGLEPYIPQALPPYQADDGDDSGSDEDQPVLAASTRREIDHYYARACELQAQGKLFEALALSHLVARSNPLHNSNNALQESLLEALQIEVPADVSSSRDHNRALSQCWEGLKQQLFSKGEGSNTTPFEELIEASVIGSDADSNSL